MLTNVRSPLRYPGAKKKVLDRFTHFWKTPHQEYRDVFVGGGSPFFGKKLAPVNWLNDLDSEVAAFFIAMRDHPDELCNRVKNTIPSVELWRAIKAEVYDNPLDKGFRTLFLNRTSFSGILKGNPIGGINQTSAYTIDCRWNPDALCKHILLCKDMLTNARITDFDFQEVIEHPGNEVLLYLDPPYYHKGNLLYRCHMNHEDHVRLSDCLQQTNHKFFLTYDDCSEIRELYADWAHLYSASWFYSSSNKKARIIGKELFISNYPIDNLKIFSLCREQ